MRRSIMAPVALLVAMKEETESRSWSASGKMTRHLAILLRSELFPSQPLASPTFHILHPLVDVDFFAWAIEAFLDSSTQPFELGFAALLALLDQAQAVADDLARCGVAATLDQLLDDAFKMLADAVAGGHGHLRITA